MHAMPETLRSHSWLSITAILVLATLLVGSSSLPRGNLAEAEPLKRTLDDPTKAIGVYLTTKI